MGGHTQSNLVERDGCVVEVDELGEARELPVPGTLRHDKATVSQGGVEREGAATDVAAALDLAQAVFPPGYLKRAVLFTDGVSEARRGGEDFGDERLIDVVRSNRELSAAELQERIVEAITTFTSGSFHDDVTLVVIGIN